MKRLVFLGLSLLATVGGSATALANGDSHAHGMHMWGGEWYGMVFGPLIMVVVIAGIVIVAVLVVRRLGGPQAAGRTAIDLLEERFARGEIDREEFEERRRVLMD